MEESAQSGDNTHLFDQGGPSNETFFLQGGKVETSVICERPQESHCVNSSILKELHHLNFLK